MRPMLDASKIWPATQKSMFDFHSNVVAEVKAAVENNEWVLVGMGQNPVVKSAKKFFADQNIQYRDLEYGNYVSKWKERLAIKLWSGWPTYPQIFHKGVLIGGYADLKKYHKTLA